MRRRSGAGMIGRVRVPLAAGLTHGLSDASCTRRKHSDHIRKRACLPDPVSDPLPPPPSLSSLPPVPAESPSTNAHFPSLSSLALCHLSLSHPASRAALSPACKPNTCHSCQSIRDGQWPPLRCAPGATPCREPSPRPPASRPLPKVACYYSCLGPPSILSYSSYPTARLTSRLDSLLAFSSPALPPSPAFHHHRPHDSNTTSPSDSRPNSIESSFPTSPAM